MLSDALISSGLTIASSIVILTIFGLILRMFGLSFVVLLPMVAFLIYRIWKSRIKIKNIPYLSLVVIVTGVIAQNIGLFRGGWATSEGYIFPSVHDNMWNIAIINELSYRFPPHNPAIEGILLKNHHYFYLFFLTIVHSIAKIDIFDLYFRLGPILVSFLYGVSLYSVSSLFTNNQYIRSLTVFLGYFSGSFSFLLPLIFGFKFDWKGNTFFSDQPFDQIFNPYSVFGFSLFLFGFYAFSQAINKLKTPHRGWSFLTVLFLGSLYGFKSFGGVIAILGLFITTLYVFSKHKNWPIILLFLGVLFMFLPVFILITKIGAVRLNWAPGWLLTEMMTGADKLNLPQFGQIESYYKNIGNVLGLFKIKIFELAIYTIGNLGVRILGLFYLLKNIFLNKNQYNKTGVIYIFACFIISFNLPLLFNFGASAFNIVQFTPYSLVILSVFTALGCGKIFIYLTKKRKKISAFLFLFITVLLAIPVNMKNLLGKIPFSGNVISYEQMNALSYLRENTSINNIILINPYQFAYEPILVPALSQRRVYLASPGYARQTGNNPDDREQKVRTFFEKQIDLSFLTNNQIAYIYLLKEPFYQEKYAHLFNDLGKYLKVFFENDQVVILHVGGLQKS